MAQPLIRRHYSPERLCGSDLPRFVGNFELPLWKNVGTLHSLTEDDIAFSRNVPLKPAEQLFRYRTPSMLGYFCPFIKVNLVTGLVYFLAPEAAEREQVIFETRGTRVRYLNLVVE